MIDWQPIKDLKEGHGVILCERSLYYGGYIFGVRQDNQIKVEFNGEIYQLPISLFSHYSEIQMPNT